MKQHIAFCNLLTTDLVSVSTTGDRYGLGCSSVFLQWRLIYCFLSQDPSHTQNWDFPRAMTVLALFSLTY